MNQISLINIINLWVWEEIHGNNELTVSFPHTYVLGREYNTILISHSATFGNIRFKPLFTIHIKDDYVDITWVELINLEPKQFGVRKKNNDYDLVICNPQFFENLKERIDEWAAKIKSAQNALKQKP